MLSTIGIIGCGWLGLPLASRLISQGYRVIGTTTRKEQVALLNAAGVEAHALVVHDHGVLTDLKDVGDILVLIITVPFKRHLDRPDVYQQWIKHILNLWSSVKRKPYVIFTSSTMIYGDLAGVVNEDTPLELIHERAQVLAEVEQEIVRLKGTVLRLGGLFGPRRQIGDWTKKSAVMGPGDQPMNLIHQEDAVGLIEALIKRPQPGEIFNGVAPTHPTRAMLYEAVVKAQSLPMPVFEGQAKAAKVVDSQKIVKRLNYRFLYPDIVAAATVK